MGKHFTFHDRKILHQLLKQKMSKLKIAEVLQRSRQSVYSEINRNRGLRGYRPKQAQCKAEERRQSSRRSMKMSDPQIERYVTERLKKCWSPEQITGRMKIDFANQKRGRLSTQTVYNWLQPRLAEWQDCLRHGRQRPKQDKRGQMVGCVRIATRPDVINKRRRHGDWEGDTIVGRRRRNAVLTLVERKTGYTKCGKLNSMQSGPAMQSAAQQLGRLPRRLRRSLTLDNGKEFALHARLTKQTGVEVYFADPYAAWQRGTNENLNGLLRQFYPKGTDFSQINRYDIIRKQKLLNERPRKRLRFKTPQELFNRLLRQL